MAKRSPIFVSSLLSLCFALGSGCAGGDATSDLATLESPLVQTHLATCSRLDVRAGSIGDGQSAGTLAYRELSGTEDVWERYVEFSPNTRSVCTFPLPAGVASSSVTRIQVQTNYRGPSKTAMLWTFHAWDYSTSTWVKVGDNAFARDWVWTPGLLEVPAPVGRFIRNGAIQIRYGTSSSYDASLLDELVLVVSSDVGTPPSGIYRPRPGESWQWQLTQPIDRSFNVAMYDVDLFDTPLATIDALRSEGRKVVCYFSAGSYESWRPDASRFPPSALGNNLDDWPGERWIDTRNTAVREIMLSRLDLAVSKRCDGVEPDNVDGYANNPGFPLTFDTQLDFNRFLASEAHRRGLSIGLKNDLDQVAQLVNDFDWALNEECAQYNECHLLRPFIDQGKAVFHTEYRTSCPSPIPGFSTLLKRLELDAWRVACPYVAP